MSELLEKCTLAKDAGYKMVSVSTVTKDNALEAIANALVERADEIIAANNIDIENAKKNGVDAIFELGTADKVNEKFDFVCANILHFVLAEIMGDLKNLMKKGAIMSLSGILDEKKQMVIDAYEKENLELIEEIHQDQWTSFVVKRID